MKYYLKLKGEKIIQTSNKPFEEQSKEIEVPINFQSKGVCNNNWSEIFNWIESNTNYYRVIE